LPDQLSK